MKKEELKILIEKEMESKLSKRQENLLDGLIDTYESLISIELNPLPIINRSSMDVVLKEKYLDSLATTRKEELEDKFFQSVFCLVLSRKVNVKKVKP